MSWYYYTDGTDDTRLYADGHCYQFSHGTMTYCGLCSPENIRRLCQDGREAGREGSSMTEEKKAWYEGIPLPVDADGEPIRIGDVLYSRGNECRVVRITVKADGACVGVHTDEGVFLPSVNPKYLSHKNSEPPEHEPADSFERLADDLGRYEESGCVCGYFGKTASGTCVGCPAKHDDHRSGCVWIALNDIARRVAALSEVTRCIRDSRGED